MTRIIAPRVHDLGGLQVRRAVPSIQARSIGPFVFVDHIGPALFTPGHGVDVRPHPHIGLATVTFLWSGTINHRDSLGSVQDIQAGDVNWMTAGCGITHSERTPATLREHEHPLHGMQTWVALPLADEETAPAFHHHAAACLPQQHRDGCRLRIVAGRGFGEQSPVRVFSDTLYVAIDLAAGAELALDDSHAERALYLLEGEAQLDGVDLPAMHLVVLDPGSRPRLRAIDAQGDAAGRRTAGGATPRLVELRLLLARAHRTGQAGLAGWTFRPGTGRRRVHSAAGRRTRATGLPRPQLTPPAADAAGFVNGLDVGYVRSAATHHTAAYWGDRSMKKLALLVPVLLVLAAPADAQNAASCPQLPADAELTWEHRASGGSDFCRALRSDGSEAFGMYIANKSPFDPKRGNRDQAGVVDGHQIHWYRAELALQPDVKALETLIKLDNGRVAHIWLQSRSDEQLGTVMRIARDLRFNPGRRDAQVGSQ